MAFANLSLPELAALHAGIVATRKARGPLHAQLKARAAIAHEIMVSEALIARLAEAHEADDRQLRLLYA